MIDGERPIEQTRREQQTVEPREKTNRPALQMRDRVMAFPGGDIRFVLRDRDRHGERSLCVRGSN